MSITQTLILYAWWQLPCFGVAMLMSDGLPDMVGRWISLNVVTLFFVFSLYALAEIIINWGSMA